VSPPRGLFSAIIADARGSIRRPVAAVQGPRADTLEFQEPVDHQPSFEQAASVIAPIQARSAPSRLERTSRHEAIAPSVSTASDMHDAMPAGDPVADAPAASGGLVPTAAPDAQAIQALLRRDASSQHAASSPAARTGIPMPQGDRGERRSSPPSLDREEGILLADAVKPPSLYEIDPVASALPRRAMPTRADPPAPPFDAAEPVPPRRAQAHPPRDAQADPPESPFDTAMPAPSRHAQAPPPHHAQAHPPAPPFDASVPLPPLRIQAQPPRHAQTAPQRHAHAASPDESVHIGVIEVRVEAPAQPQQRAAPPPPQPVAFQGSSALSRLYVRRF
jgi:hypothetical protein